MKNKKIALLLFVIMIIMNCSSPEPDEFLYEIIISNKSNEEFEILLYENNIIINQEMLSHNETFSCTYKAEFFRALRGCNNSNNNSLDSIRIVFSNGKGYYCDSLVSNDEPDLCFGESRSPFSDGFNDLGSRRYEFVITEEDFNNAHELPE